MKKRILCALSVFALGFPLIAQDFNVQFRSKLTFPGQTLANVCGYTQDGREYALIGASKGLVIAEITNPDNPAIIAQIPGPDNLWKEIKTYRNFAYVTSEGGGGLQIVDMSALPSASLPYKSYTGDGAIAGQLNTIHALHVDTTAGFVYLFGSNLFQGGAVVLDLNADPYNPTYVGRFSQLGYIHDGFADNDTLYSGHIYAGLLAVVDMSDKSNPVLLGSVETPGKFTHNAWLTGDHKSILTTDETTPSFLTSYDISDPTDIKELDRFSTNNGFGSIGHNTHILNDWAVTSWYTDGFTIVDAHKPDNLVMTAWYDTWNGTGANFDGCWGVYPFFPSGTVIASNIEPGELFILTPTYIRACYLEGTVKGSCTGLPINGASVTVNSNVPQVNTATRSNGVFKTGQHLPGLFTVTVSAPGYQSQTFDVNFVPGEVAQLDVVLEPGSAYNVSGIVINSKTQEPIPNAPLVLYSSQQTYTINTNSNGQFDLDCMLGGVYQVIAGAWGYLPSTALNINSNGIVNIALEPGYYDDFALDYGWQVSGDGTSGEWTRGEPSGTTYQGQECNTNQDVTTDGNDQCYVTGNGGGNAGSDDVDNGAVVLSSPPIQLAAYNDAVLNFWYWFFNSGGQGTPNDYFQVVLSNGNQEATLLLESTSASAWRWSGDIHLKDYLPLTNQMSVRFIAADDAPGHLVEAAVDQFSVSPIGSVPTQNPADASAQLKVMPNPSAHTFRLEYNWPGRQDIQLELCNILGQSVVRQQLNADKGFAALGHELAPGVYFLILRSEGRQSVPIKLVKE
jgi:choice-of-anchor B domain-containing protein